jgi:hypothetical protein
MHLGRQCPDLPCSVGTELSEEDYYLILSSKSVRMQNRVGPILKAVTFLAEPREGLAPRDGEFQAQGRCYR